MINTDSTGSFTTYFNIAYCIMLIPSQIILTYVRPSYWLSGLELLWGMMTGLIALAKNAKQVYVLRAFLGLCESSAWPGMMTLFSTRSQYQTFDAQELMEYSALVHTHRTSQTYGLLSLLSGSWQYDVWSAASCGHQHT